MAPQSSPTVISTSTSGFTMFCQQVKLSKHEKSTLTDAQCVTEYVIFIDCCLDSDWQREIYRVQTRIMFVMNARVFAQGLSIYDGSTAPPVC